MKSILSSHPFIFPITLCLLLFLPVFVVAQSTWITDFAEFDAEDYYEGRDGYWDEEGEFYVLNIAENNVHGRIYNIQDFSMATFVAEFDIRIGGGNGADGMVFGWVADYEYAENGGGSHDFSNADGFAIEFDCYNNGGADPNGQHIGLLEDTYTNHLATYEMEEGEMEDDEWHHVIVTNYRGHIEVIWEDEVVLEHDIEDYEAFDGYFGFSGSTGGLNNMHRVDNIELSSRGPEMMWRPEELDFGVVVADSVTTVLTIHNVTGYFDLEYTIDDGNDDPDWLSVDADLAEGVIAAGDSVEIAVIAITGNLEPGRHESVLVVTSSDLENERVEITVSIFMVEGVGRLYGVVTNASNDQPVEGAILTVYAEQMAVASDTSDAEGFYSFEELPAWIYEIWLSREGFLMMGEEDIEIGEDEEVERNFALLHSEFNVEPDSLVVELFRDDIQEFPLTISNWGNGPLTWNLNLVFPVEVEAEPWELRQSFNAGEQVDDTRLEGVVYVDGQYFISGSAGGEPNAIYILNSEGEQVGEFEQPGESVWGMKDLAWDGELIWGSGDRTIFGFTTEGESVSSFRGPERLNQNLAWDGDREWLWICDRYTEIYGYDRDGNEQVQFDNPGFSVTGLAYWPDDPDTMQLYILHNVDDHPYIHKMDVESGDTAFVRQLEADWGGAPKGAFISNQLDRYSWVFGNIADVIADDGGDRIQLWQLFSNTGWASADPMEGTVEADDEEVVTVSLVSGSMMPEEYQVDLVFSHDAAGGTDTVGIFMTIIDEDPPPPPPPPPFEPSPPVLLLPADGDTLERENLMFTWGDTIPIHPGIPYDLSYEVWMMTGGDSMVIEPDSFRFELVEDDTLFEVVCYIDSLWMLINAETPITWWIVANWESDSLDDVELYSLNRFRFYFRLLALNGGNGLPVTFGLHALYPNPFNAQLRVDFGLEAPGEARLSIYDLSGREVNTVTSGRRERGLHRVWWDARDAPSGVYLVRLTAGEQVQTRKVTLVR